MTEIDIWGGKESRRESYCVAPTEKRRAKIRAALSYLKTSHLQIRRKNYKEIYSSRVPFALRRDGREKYSSKTG